MSVIVRDETGSVLLFCKGAEVSMLPIVSSGPFEETITHYTDFAMVCYFYFLFVSVIDKHRFKYTQITFIEITNR